MPSLTGTPDHLPYSLRMGLARGTAISNAAPCSSLPSRRQRLLSLGDRRRGTSLRRAPMRAGPVPLPTPPRAPPKFSESRRRSVDDRPRRDPWHPSAAGWHHRSTALQLQSLGEFLKKKTLKKKRPLPVMIEGTSASDGQTRRDVYRSRPAAAIRNRRAQSCFEPAGPSWRASFYI